MEEGTINKAPHNGGKKWPTRHPIRRREDEENLMKGGKIPEEMYTDFPSLSGLGRLLHYSRAYIQRVSRGVDAKELGLACRKMSLWLGILVLIGSKLQGDPSHW